MGLFPLAPAKLDLNRFVWVIWHRFGTDYSDYLYSPSDMGYLIFVANMLPGTGCFKTDRYGFQYGSAGGSMSPSEPYTQGASLVQCDIPACPYNSGNSSTHDLGISQAGAVH